MANSPDPTLRTGLASVFGAQALVALGVLAMVAWNLDAIMHRFEAVIFLRGF